MPLGASFSGIFVSLFLKSKKIFLLSLAFLYFFSLGITSDLLISYIEKPYKIIPLKKVKNTNSIVVLSGMREFIQKKQEVLEWKDPDRFFAAIRLFKEGKSKRIIFTDGYSPFYGTQLTEGILNRKDAISIGIPPRAVMVTGKANNTFEETEQLKKLFEKKKFLSNEIILITSAFHMKRAKNLFERAGFKVLEFPVDFKSKCIKPKLMYNLICLLPDSGSLYKSSFVIREIIGRFYYKIN
tara:strand:- start:318 stop:1037 length:720 start_codon:yes stop_codon:yes gene_type:complete